MSNQIYYCKIVDTQEKDSTKINEVVIRLYGNIPIFNKMSKHIQFNQTIIGLLVSDYGLGPKVYGMFSEGQVQKYYPVS